MRIKIGLALGAALAAALLPVGSIGAQNATDAWIDVVHGIGGGANPVDVYVGGGTAPTEWDLAIADLQYGEHVEIGEIAAGDYNVLVCQAVPAPADTISSCPQGAVNGNFGNPIELVANERYLVVAAYGGPETEAPGRPIVQPYEIDDSCVENDETARVQGVHAAAAPAVDITADGEVIFEDVTFGESAVADVPAGPYDIGVQLPDGTPVIAPEEVPLEAVQSTIGVVVGNPQQEVSYEVLAFGLELDVCAPAPTSTSTTATTIITTTTAPARVATPAFTG